MRIRGEAVKPESPQKQLENRDTDRSPKAAGRPKGQTRRPRRKEHILILIGLPGAIALILFQYVPLLGHSIAFQDYQPFLGIQESPWVGWQNFSLLSDDPDFWNAVKNTAILTLIQTVLVFPIPLALALVLDTIIRERVRRSIQSVLYLPHFLSWVIVVALFQQMLGNAGVVNTILAEYDLPTFSVIGVPDLFKALLTSQVIWKDAGWGTIIFLAAISRVDNELYEAAAMDGAGAWRRMVHVTLPALKGVFILLLILRLGNSLSVGFEQIILQQGPVGLEASEVIDTWVYNFGITGGEWGVTAAAGLIKGIVGILIVLGANKLAHVFGERGVYHR